MTLSEDLHDKDHKLAADHNRVSLFARIDRNHDGSIDADEFEQFYQVIKAEAAEEIRHEQQLEAKLKRTKRRVGVLWKFLALVIFFVGVLLIGNACLVWALLEMSKDVNIGGSDMMIKGGNDIVGTKEALAAVPLFVAPVMPAEELAGVRFITANHAVPVPLKNVSIGMPDFGRQTVSSTLFIDKITKFNSTYMTFHTTSGETVTLLNGYAHLHDPLTDFTTDLCAADASCAALRVETDASATLVASAVSELRAAGANRTIFNLGYHPDGTPVAPPSADALASRRLSESGEDAWDETIVYNYFWTEKPDKTDPKGVLYSFSLDWSCTQTYPAAPICDVVSGTMSFDPKCKVEDGSYTHCVAGTDANNNGQGGNAPLGFDADGNFLLMVPEVIQNHGKFPEPARPGGWVVCYGDEDTDECQCLSYPPMYWDFAQQSWILYCPPNAGPGDCVCSVDVISSYANDQCGLDDDDDDDRRRRLEESEAKITGKNLAQQRGPLPRTPKVHAVEARRLSEEEDCKIETCGNSGSGSPPGGPCCGPCSQCSLFPHHDMWTCMPCCPFRGGCGCAPWAPETC